MTTDSAPLDPAFDLRSDALTQPTEEMWEAMRSLRPGWAPAGEDEAVDRLERLGAERSGKEASVLVPTGGMGNLVALMAHTRRGDQVVLEAASHILWNEEWGFAYVCGLAPRTVEAPDGMPTAGQLEAVITRSTFGFEAPTALVCLENTHNGRGGAVAGVAATAAACAQAHAHGAAVHVDGARILNACAALDVELADLVADADSVMLNLNKGLSSLGGALVCGSAELIGRCRQALGRLSAANFHQAGIIAAAGIVALERMEPQLREDNRRARRLAEALIPIAGLDPRPRQVASNIVMGHLDPRLIGAGELARDLRAAGIGALPYDEATIRFVTHRHVTDEVVERLATVLGERLGRAEPTAPELA